MVTGSARLDYCRKGGDSLTNRYRYFRLHRCPRERASAAYGAKTSGGGSSSMR